MLLNPMGASGDRWERVGTGGDEGERSLCEWERPFCATDWNLCPEINVLVNKQIFRMESQFLSSMKALIMHKTNQ